MPDIIPSEMILERSRDGTIYARSPVALGTYPDAITDRLMYWAERAPDRTFIARRDTAGEWLRLSYSDTLARVQRVAQALLDRRLSPNRPLVILSGNSLEHAVLALAAMHVGVLYAPLSPAYALLAREYTTLRTIWQALTPGLVFADEGERFERALSNVAVNTEIVTCTSPAGLRATSFSELQSTAATTAVEDAHRTVGPDTIAKILYTSGSTGRPKGVINTQRMLCANQEMLRTVMPLLADTPVLCDWLPWNHTFGGNHNFGIALYNGGTLYIDDGKPMPGLFETTVANLRDVPVTAYFNVPKGYEMLVPRLRSDGELRKSFFANVRMLFCAAASMRRQVADEVLEMAATGGRHRVPLVTGLGATETAPFALCAGDSEFGSGRVGVPAPGVELKLAPVGSLYEARVKGPAVTPGYWRDAGLTAAAFDEDGYYRMGDALAFYSPADPLKGFTFQGRLSEDFKLSTGTWVRVGPLREQLLLHFGELVQNVVIAGDARDEVTALVFPSVEACRAMCGVEAKALAPRAVLERAEVRAAFAARLASFCARNIGNSTAVPRMILLDEPASIDAQELTDKGSVNQKQVLANRAAMVEQLYGADGPGILVAASTSSETLT